MMKVKYYKCPICSKKFKTLNGWGNHMDTTHPDNRPEGYSTSRYFYFVMTGKEHGICRTCKKDTPWNESSMKYDQYCTNPECKQAYAKMAKQRMIGKYGKVHLLNNPDMQKKMLENRKISGKYRFSDGTEFSYVGSYEKEFLRMLDTLMQWHTNDIISPSPHTYYYNYKNPKDENNEGVKFYIPDFYIPSLNLEIEIKQQTSGNKAMNDINRVKEALKDEVMKSNPEVNYLKINDNDFTPFFEFLMKAKEYFPTPENIKKNQMDLVMESYVSGLESMNEVQDPVITKTFEVFDKDGYSNQCVMVNGYDKPLRGRSEILIIKDDKVFLSLKGNDTCKYVVPGGGWDVEDKDHKMSAIREAQEEVRINVKNVKPIGIYIDYNNTPAKWVTEKISKKDWWYGYYTEVYIGEYDSKYTGKISAHDKDNMINTGKFYNISDVYSMLKPMHKRAIDTIVSNDTNSIAIEGLLSFLGVNGDKSIITPKTWFDTFQIKKNLLGPFGFYGVNIQNGMIEIHGINFNILQSRIKRYYDDKSINNIFIPKYNAMSYKRFKKKKIQRCEIKIDYMTTPEFFALELVNLFTDLGKRYRDRAYLGMATQIYNNSWLSEADNKAESIPFLDTKNLENLSLDLNSYQKEFIEKYPKLKAQLNLNGYILAFEQGLGKTLTAIGLSECLNVDHVYIVCPNSLKENWALEIKKYYKKYEDDDLWKQEVFICSDKQIYFNQDTTRFMIINNESIEKMYPYVMSGKNMLILDESHNFRNLKSKRVNQLIELKNKLKCKDTLVMSGTPIKATPDEIVPALMLIDPTFTITAATCFTKAFKLKSSLGTSLVETRFGKIMYRKEKDVLENKLPEKYIKTLSVSIADKDKYVMKHVNEVVMNRFSEIYDSGISDAMKLRKEFMEMSKKYSAEPGRFDEFKKLIDDMVKKDIYLHEIDQMFVEKYMRETTSKITNKQERNQYIFLIKNFVRYKAHCLGVAFGEILPKYRRDMFISMYSENSSEIFKMIKENTKKTLIFSQFKGVANYIYHDLCDNGIGAVCITGDVKNRMEILRAFKENDSISVLVATSQTIGTGVTLVEANQMFFFGPPWRQADFDQCSDRIHRIGQTDDVYIYSVILDTGAELNLSTRMDDILVWSKKMTESVINTSKDEDDIDETHFEELLKAEESNNTLIANEGYVFDKETIKHKVDEFESNKSNILLITGLSGSGKSTTAKKYAEEYNGEFIELDCFEQNYGMNDLQLKEAGAPFYIYLTQTPSGKLFRKKSLSNNRPRGDELVKEIKTFGNWLLKWCEGHKDTKWIIEGVQIYSCFDFNNVKKYPIIINGVSMLKSIKRRIGRNGHEGEFIKMVEWYISEEKSLSQFKNSIAKEAYIFSKDDIVLNLDKFITNEKNVLLITGLSRSGKTTLAGNFASKYNAEIIQLDLFENYYCMGDEYGKPFVLELRKKWFNTTVGKQYKSICDNDPDNITQQELSTYMRDAFLFILRYCTFHKKTRYIIEGLQIYSDVESSLVKDYPIIIKGTSMLKSFMRRSNKSIDNLAYYIQTEKELKKFRDEVSVETFISDDKELLNDFMCISNDVYE